VANPYSIHLVEPLSLEVAQRVANETASQLGGTPDKLAQLLTRNSGSRIARASSAAQADRVASILRKAGVTVQVVDPEVIENVAAGAQPHEPAAPGINQSQVTDSPQISPANQQVNVQASAVPEIPVSNYDVNAGSSSFSSGGTPIVPDEIIPVDDAPYVLRATHQDPAPMPDLFPAINSSIAPPNDPFATDNKDLFNSDPVPYSPTPASDPFGAPARGASNTPANDPFAAPANNPFAEPARGDPFAGPKNDPFAAPANNPFASSSAQDPFAPAAGVVSSNVDTPPAFDPFAASQVTAAVSDLPAQALKAQNRTTSRTSVRAQLLSSILLPLLLVGVGIVLFLAYQLNITFKEQLRLRALQAAGAINLSVNKTFSQLIDPALAPNALEQIKQNSVRAFALLPEYEFLFFETHNPKIKLAGQFAVQSRVALTSDQTEDIAKKIEGFGDAKAGQFSQNGIDFMGAIAVLENDKKEVLGDLYIGLSTSSIPDAILKAVIPLLIALLIVTLFAIVLANTLASRLVRPITAAADQANRISLGDLDRIVEIQSNDEIGDLLGSLERMRVSLKSVIGRLRRDR
jgi:HAMP domain-containing protein